MKTENQDMDLLIAAICHFMVETLIFINFAFHIYAVSYVLAKISCTKTLEISSICSINSVCNGLLYILIL